jgi:CIC family chloride channel protein
VVLNDVPNIVLGLPSRRAIIDFYNKRLAALRQKREKG